MSQEFLHLMVGEVEDKVAAELAKAGFRVARSDRMVGGLDVRVRSGTNDIITRAFAGMRREDEELVFDPRLPDGLGSARFTVVHRGRRLRVTVTPDRVQVKPDRRATTGRSSSGQGART